MPPAIRRLVPSLSGRSKAARVTIELLSRCEVVVEHAAHHVAWLRRNGIQNCLYFPNPVDDAGGPEWEARRESSATEGKPKILMAGHLRGIATLSGLHLLADETLPILERILGPDGFEVHIVGADALPPRLAAKLARPSVRLRGYVEDIHQEFLTSDVLFVPTPIELGFRTRIAEGFSFGCCVVAHSANALGMPELVHRENALLAPDGAGLADQLVRALGDPALRSRLRRNARQTYEQKLDSRLVCASIAAELERIASSPKARELA